MSQFGPCAPCGRDQEGRRPEEELRTYLPGGSESAAFSREYSRPCNLQETGSTVCGTFPHRQGKQSSSCTLWTGWDMVQKRESLFLHFISWTLLSSLTSTVIIGDCLVAGPKAGGSVPLQWSDVLSWPESNFLYRPDNSNAALKSAKNKQQFKAA